MNVAFYILCVILTALSSAQALPTDPASCTFSVNGTTVNGLSTSTGACRYSIRYAHAERWGYSAIATNLDNQATTALPPSCPQDSGTYVDAATQSEDCLFAVVYTPPAVTAQSDLPVLVWIYGGSFIAGSASAPGLDGSRLAVKGKLIVVVLQYRLGVLGYIPPTLAPSSGDPNLGLLDVINGLNAVQSYVSFAGGDKSKVTVGGQSSGAQVIRGLWGAPTAKGLFRAAILQSDPMSYGFQSMTLLSELRSAFYGEAPMSGCETLGCLQAIPVSTLISKQDTLIADAPGNFTGVALAEPIRPTYGFASLPNDPTDSLFNSPSSLIVSPPSLPLLITTVKNEAGSVTERLFPDPVPLSSTTWSQSLSGLFGDDRAAAIVSSPYYILNSSGNTGGDGFRETFERLATDGTWRCVNRDVARRWAADGGKVWVGEFRQGTTYPDNDISDGYCEQAGRVCHEDDIYATFGSAPSPSANTTAFEDEIEGHWASFITTLDPNPSGSTQNRACPQDVYPQPRSTSTTWTEYTSTSTTGEILALGGDEQVSGCPPNGFWGGTVKYDWQLYG